MPIYAGPDATAAERRALQQFLQKRPELSTPQIRTPSPATLPGLKVRTITQASTQSRRTQPGIRPDTRTATSLPESQTISLSQAERDAALARMAAATCRADAKKWEIRTYKLTLKDGSHIFVESVGPDKNKAVNIAKAAGYDVAWARWVPDYETAAPSAPSVASGTVSVRDGKTGETLKFPRAGWDAWPDKYKTIVKQDGYDAAMTEFRRDYRQLGDGQWILRSDFNRLSDHYATIALGKGGFSAMQQAFERDHVKLGDGQWITRADWDALVANDKANGTTFSDIGKSQGYDAMVTAIDKANEPYEEFQKKLQRGEIIAIPGDQYITREQFDKLPSGSQQIVMRQGLDALTKATTVTYQKVNKPKGAGWDPIFQKRLAKWESLPDSLTQQEINQLPFADREYYRLSEGSYKRAGLLSLASLMPPAKAALPEFTKADITAVDWGIAAAQAPLIVMGFAPSAISASVLGKAATVAGSSALAGLIGYGTAKSWSSLTPGQRAMGVGMAALCAIPLLTTVARNVKVSGPAIPTTQGEVVSWKGLSVAGQPIIGRSGGKWVLGTRGLTLPEARMILNGYKPETMLETKIFVNRTALEKAGFTRAQVDYLTQTLKDRNLFAGKTSPWLDKDVLLEPTQRLNANEIDAIVTRLNRLEQGKMGSVKDAYLLYGSPTIKAQAAPGLRGWRPIHDWDISLNMNQAQTETFTQALLRDLNAKGGGTYRISSQSPTLIEKKIGGAWEHIADIHSQEVAVTSAMDISASRLDATGDYSYGRMVAEPAVTVKYPGVGELRIMRLSESGVRKADTILRVRQTGEGVAFRPPERGIAQPGVPKDAADFYVTLRTFEGEALAEEWLQSWAKAMGYTETELRGVLPKIRNAMLEVASQTPSSIIGYEFRPATSPRVSVGASPSITVHIPSSLGASASASLARRISQPIYPYKLSSSPRMQAALSAAVSAVASRAPSKALASPKLSPSVARLISATASPKPSPSPAVSKVPSPSPKPSASPIPSVAPSGKPSPSVKPSGVPSAKPSPSPTPSPVPSPTPTPSPTPSPYPQPHPAPGPKPKPWPQSSTAQPSQKARREGPALATWKQGLYWISVFPPFRTKGGKPDVVYSRKRPQYAAVVARGRRAPMRTLRAFGRIPPLVEVPMGITTAQIRNGRQLVFSRRGTNGRKRRR